MYILSLQDDETTQLIGAFNTEEDVVSWINSVPNVKKDHNDNYILKIEDLTEFILILNGRILLFHLLNIPLVRANTYTLVGKK
ncbi:hypothetical protein [Mammaliicoccus lentus]|uniref:hypothetical protein n=1 Tax=Mammaliicoccus lentus TaxID=42858 RepID=UPI003CED730B